MRAVFIRHGQSTGNAGLPCHDLALLELTELGWRQAREVAAVWRERPDLIVTSPYLRTQQTSRPTRERFPDVPVEVWPIEEFTYLQPSRWNGTLSVERKGSVERYWQACDPAYCDGEGAESFSTLLRRAEAALTLLAQLPEDALAYVFSHGQFIQAVRMTVLYPEADDKERMRLFWREDGASAVANGERVGLEHREAGWQIETAVSEAEGTSKENAMPASA